MAECDTMAANELGKGSRWCYRASTTTRRLQWWGNDPEQDAMPSVLQNLHMALRVGRRNGPISPPLSHPHPICPRSTPTRGFLVVGWRSTTKRIESFTRCVHLPHGLHSGNAGTWGEATSHKQL